MSRHFPSEWGSYIQINEGGVKMGAILRKVQAGVQGG
jgi:hypothetical protein